jgi:hypothetical protein
VIAFEVDLMYVNHTSKLKFATNNLQNDIVVKYRVYEIQLMSLNFKYKLDITVCSNFNSYKSLRITACTQKHKSFTDSIASYPKFPWVKDLVFNAPLISWQLHGAVRSLSIYRVSQKKVMPFVIQICRELLVVEI